MSDLATLKGWKLEAELALHRLQTGSREETVKFGHNREVKFTPVRVAELRAYVAELDAKIAVAEGRRARAPIYVVLPS